MGVGIWIWISGGNWFGIGIVCAVDIWILLFGEVISRVFLFLFLLVVYDVGGFAALGDSYDVREYIFRIAHDEIAIWMMIQCSNEVEYSDRTVPYSTIIIKHRFL